MLLRYSLLNCIETKLFFAGGPYMALAVSDPCYYSTVLVRQRLSKMPTGRGTISIMIETPPICGLRLGSIDYPPDQLHCIQVYFAHFTKKGLLTFVDQSKGMKLRMHVWQLCSKVQFADPAMRTNKLQIADRAAAHCLQLQIILGSLYVCRGLLSSRALFLIGSDRHNATHCVSQSMLASLLAGAQ